MKANSVLGTSPIINTLNRGSNKDNLPLYIINKASTEHIYGYKYAEVLTNISGFKQCHLQKEFTLLL